MLAKAEGKDRRTKADLHSSEASPYLSYVTESQTETQNEAENRQPNTTEMSSSHSPALRPHLLVAERSRGPQGRCGSQAAQAPRLGGLRRLQGPPVDGGVRSAVVGGVGQRVVGRRQGYRLAVRMLAGWGDRMGGELQGKRA